jgi:3-hydroxyisobutyrate dehydrogenase-like beta-hydroxyacid dehydrogenase
LFGNAMIITLAAGLADVYTMAKALDIPAPDAHALFSKFNAAATIAVRGANMAQGNYQPSFAMTMARKDVRLMIEAAGGEKLDLMSSIADHMDQLIREGYGEDDLGALAIKAVPKR